MNECFPSSVLFSRAAFCASGFRVFSPRWKRPLLLLMKWSLYLNLRVSCVLTSSINYFCRSSSSSSSSSLFFFPKRGVVVVLCAYNLYKKGTRHRHALRRIYSFPLSHTRSLLSRSFPANCCSGILSTFFVFLAHIYARGCFSRTLA